MSPEKDWYDEFKMILENRGLIEGLELQRKYTTSWSNVCFTITPIDAANAILEFTTSVQHLISKRIIKHAEGHKYIHGLLLLLFDFQFDIFFILT